MDPVSKPPVKRCQLNAWREKDSEGNKKELKAELSKVKVFDRKRLLKVNLQEVSLTNKRFTEDEAFR